MIGPVDSYQSIYTAMCGATFPDRKQGVEHEGYCPACQAYLRAELEEDEADDYDVIRGEEW